VQRKLLILTSNNIDTDEQDDYCAQIYDYLGDRLEEKSRFEGKIELHCGFTGVSTSTGAKIDQAEFMTFLEKNGYCLPDTRIDGVPFNDPYGFPGFLIEVVGSKPKYVLKKL
jgi:hypothetical protein